MIISLNSGSPPRVWGRRTTSWASTGRRPVHPHACGDDAWGNYMSSLMGGSPPRVWGRHTNGVRLSPKNRFTPTRVGTTGLEPSYSTFETVHPHACGDDESACQRSRRFRGSPPRVWGRPLRDERVKIGLRFTPTRVGTTLSHARQRKGHPVHPHACGDDVRLADLSALEPRFTPTRVGTTSAPSSLLLTRAVHPHACGDDLFLLPLDRLADGSPPRVWGRLQVWHTTRIFSGSPPRVWGRPCSV